MAKKNYKKPVEWVFGRVKTTDGTITNYRIELGLKDDEVAEIHKIDSRVSIGLIDSAAADDVNVDMMMGMDPDVIADPGVDTNHDDMEIFFENSLGVQTDGAVAAGLAAFVSDRQKVSDFDPPLLVGTDLGMVVHGDTTVDAEFWARVYFTRRKANVMELNQILLKRR